MEKVNSIEQGVHKLFCARGQAAPDFSFRPKGVGEYTDTLHFDGKQIPLFFSCCDQRYEGMSQYGMEAACNSALNVYAFVGCDVPLEQLIFEELELSEYILHAAICKITAFVNRNAVSLIAVMDNGTTANLDLGNTLAPGSSKKCQHRLITSHGMACDVAVGTMFPPSQVHLFGTDCHAPAIYDDDNYLLYGLSAGDVSRAVLIYKLLSGGAEPSGWQEKAARLKRAVKAVFQSSDEGKTVFVEEETV